MSSDSRNAVTVKVLDGFICSLCTLYESKVTPSHLAKFVMRVTVISHYLQLYANLYLSGNTPMLQNDTKRSCQLWFTVYRQETVMETNSLQTYKKQAIFPISFVRMKLPPSLSQLLGNDKPGISSEVTRQRRELIRQAGCAGVMYEPSLCIRTPATQSHRAPSRQTFGPK